MQEVVNTITSIFKPPASNLKKIRNITYDNTRKSETLVK